MFPRRGLLMWQIKCQVRAQYEARNVCGKGNALTIEPFSFPRTFWMCIMQFYSVVQIKTDINSCLTKEACNFLIQIILCVLRIMGVGSFSTPIPTVPQLGAESLYDREDSHHKTSQKAWKLHYRNPAILVNLSGQSSKEHALFLSPSGA